MTINKTQQNNQYLGLVKSITRYTFFGSIFVFACYLYTIGAVTFSVIERQGLEQSQKQLISNISMQELKYLEEEKRLTKDVAYSFGMVEPKSISFTEQKRAFAWNVGR